MNLQVKEQMVLTTRFGLKYLEAQRQITGEVIQQHW
jgi:hypothetical protein